MSQDLLSFFLDNSTAQSAPAPQSGRAPSSNQNNNPWRSEGSSIWQESSVLQTQSSADDDDDFGDFEDASTHTAASVPETTSKAPQSWNSGPNTPTTRPAPVRNSAPVSPRPPSNPETKAKDVATGQHPFAGRMDLLFDTGDDEYDAGADELGDLATNPEAAMAYSKRIIAEQEATAAAAAAATSKLQKSEPQQSTERSSKHNVPTKSISRAQTIPKDPNVLFDADHVSESEDEFGGFESGNESGDMEAVNVPKAKQSIPNAMPATDLLGLDDDIPLPEVKNAVDRTSTAVKTPTVSVKHTNSSLAQSREYLEAENDTWDDFETEAPTDNPWASESSQPAQSMTKLSTVLHTNTKPHSEVSLPPTNIPPPAVLISIFPSIIAEADDALFNAIGRLDLKQRQMLLGHPASHQFLKGYLSHATVMARIIAGRKLRWKRDQHLTQSMRIGPAAAGGKGGMKLAGLDKTESTKEDREVVDALRLWRNQVGKVRTAVTAASAAPSGTKLPHVPEIAEQMPVKVLNAVEGGFTAPHACALCGLKREERVGKVDVEVDDSFGEWWVQGMNMHLSCRDFWNEYAKKLKSR